jgi:class 3 adenylate cyclase
MSSEPGEETSSQAAGQTEERPQRTDDRPVAAPTAAPVKVSRAPSSSRFFRAISSLSVKYKIAGTLLAVLVVAVASLGIVTFTYQNAMLRNEMRSRASILAHQLASVGKEGLLTRQELPVFTAIADIQKRADVVYAIVVDADGKVFAHSGLSGNGETLTGPADRAALAANDLLFQEAVFRGDTVLDAAMPIMLKTKELRLGVARIGLSEKALHASIRKQAEVYLWIALGFAVAGIVVSFALARLLTKPLDALDRGIQVVTKGDLRKLVEIHYDDEIGKLTRAFNQMIQSLREKLLMEKYLSQSTVLSIKEHRDVTQLKLGGERKYVTALFSDARGFTALSEKMSPEEVVSLMNIYLNLQTSVIHQWGGIVDKFVGDEVMAIFEGRGMEINAVRAAVEIENFCKSLNSARAASGEKQIFVGIGLNSGEVVMGNMGSEDHMDYTVIGDNINVAARLCGVAQPGQVLASKTIADIIADQATWKELPPVQVKGKEQPVGIAEPIAIKGGSRRYMRKNTDFSVAYSLEGFPDEANSATVRNISAAGCLMVTTAPIGIGSQLNLTFSSVSLGDIAVRGSVYHARRQEQAYYVGLCFENLPDDIRYRIIHWIHQVNSEIAPGLFL